MRRRRFTRCILRGETAIESGALEDARAALDEARELFPDAPEVAALEARMAEGPVASASPSPSALTDDLPLVLEGEDISDGPEESDEPTFLHAPTFELVHSGQRGAGPVARAAAAVVVFALLGVAGYGLTQIYLNRSPYARPQIAAASPAETPARVERAPDVSASHPVAPRPQPEKPPILQAGGAAIPNAATTVRRTGNPAGRRVPREERLRPPSSTAAKAPISRPMSPVPEPPARASREEPAPMPPTAATERRELAEPPAAAPAPVTPLRDSGTSTSSDAAPRTAAPPPPPVGSAPASGDDASQIRGVLALYESAYNRLDARAASSVWPGVNRGALNRAFEGLVYQKISLGACDITKIGANGLATCVGRATWEPKVGGGIQSAQRYWAFDLQRKPEGWRIVQIRVR